MNDMSRNHYHSTPAKRHVGLWNFHHVTSKMVYLGSWSIDLTEGNKLSSKSHGLSTGKIWQMVIYI